MPPPIDLITASHPNHPGWDTGVSHALALAVGRGDLPETIRLYVPSRIVAFGRRDTVSPGYGAAVQAAVDAGFEPIERLAGGRAAVFTETTVAFGWVTPEPDPRTRITERFEMVSSIIAAALLNLGVGARVGRVPGEYCPGDHSISIDGRLKVVGIGQRLVRGAAHVGGVIVCDRSDLIVRALTPVYRALEIDWDPATAGALSHSQPGITPGAVIDALVAAIGKVRSVRPAGLDVTVLDEGRRLAADHRPGVTPRRR